MSQVISTRAENTMDVNNLNTFDEYTSYFTQYPLSWYDRNFLENFINRYKNKIDDILDLFDSVATTEQLIKDLFEVCHNLEIVVHMICDTRKYLEKKKYSCGVCGVHVNQDNLPQGGAPDCAICYILLCKDCAKYGGDTDYYCHQCFTEDIYDDEKNSQDTEDSCNECSSHHDEWFH